MKKMFNLRTVAMIIMATIATVAIAGCNQSTDVNQESTSTPSSTVSEVRQDEESSKEVSKEESSKVESSMGESSRAETSVEEKSSKEESSKVESSKEESSKAESSIEEKSNVETSKEEPSNVGSSKEESSKVETSIEERSKAEPSKVESSTEESSKEVSKTESSVTEPSKVENSELDGSSIIRFGRVIKETKVETSPNQFHIMKVDYIVGIVSIHNDTVDILYQNFALSVDISSIEIYDEDYVPDLYNNATFGFSVG